jgi:FO synthase
LRADLVTFLRRDGATATVREVAAALADGVLPVETGAGNASPIAWVVPHEAALRLLADGVPWWRVTVLCEGARDDVLDAVARTGAPYLRADAATLDTAASIAILPGLRVAASVPVADLDAALDAVARGARDLIVDGWDDASIGALRDALEPVALVERTALPPGVEIDALRDTLDRPMFTAYLQQVDASGAARPRYEWAPGKDMEPPVPLRRLSVEWPDEAWTGAAGEEGLARIPADLRAILERSLEGTPPTRDEVERLFESRGREVEAVAWAADRLRQERCGDVVTYVINRNINYTNQCYFRCGFCGFSKGPKSLSLRGDPYLITAQEVVDRSVEAWDLGATEVCLQGGIHPDFTGDFYVGILEAIKERLPEMHVHGFTALEVWQGAHTLGVPLRDYMKRLKDSGLGTLPGTAAEVLDDDIRLHLCPDKIRTSQWAEVHITAHELGFRSNNTLMFGHIDHPRSWANHFEVARDIQRRTGGFTEFVPLPFVHMASPIHLMGKSRPGPTWDEVVLVHAVGRLAFDGLIPNIQASWVKLGLDGGGRLLDVGCNDLGGTLMNENISRASGASHGQLATAEELEATIRAAGRIPARRSTTYDILEQATPA